jgi:hypothetical protein
MNKANLTDKERWLLSLKVKDIMKLSDSEKDALILLKRKRRQAEEDFEFVIDRESPVEFIVNDQNRIINFSFAEIARYAKDGVIIDKYYYEFATPEVASPAYMGASAAGSYLYGAMSASVVAVMPKWDGRSFRSARLTSCAATKTVLFEGDVALLVDDTLSCGHFEELADRIICLEGGSHLEDISLPLESTADMRPLETDGVVIVSASCDFRVKEKRTLDLYAKDGQLFDSGLKVVGTIEKVHSGVIEVTEELEFVRPRPDKMTALSAAQVAQVKKSVVLSTLPTPITPRVCVWAHLHHGIFECASLLCRGELLWTMDSVRKAYESLGIGYFPVDEIFNSLVPFVNSKITSVERKYGSSSITVSGSCLRISYPPLVALNYTAIYQCLMDKVASKSFNGIIRHLLNIGYVFTASDFRAIRDLHFRGYSGVLVRNFGYFTYVRPCTVYNSVDFEGTSDLPVLKFVRGRGEFLVPAARMCANIVPFTLDVNGVSEEELKIISGFDRATLKEWLTFNNKTPALDSVIFRLSRMGTVVPRFSLSSAKLAEYIEVNGPTSIKHLSKVFNVPVPIIREAVVELFATLWEKRGIVGIKS